MLKKILAWLFKAQNKAVFEYVKSLEERLKKEKEIQYVTINIPENDKLQTFLSELGRNEYFSFYIQCIENELISGFVNGKESEIYKGGLKVAKRIKEDVKQALKNEETIRIKAENGQV